MSENLSLESEPESVYFTARADLNDPANQAGSEEANANVVQDFFNNQIILELEQRLVNSNLNY